MQLDSFTILVAGCAVLVLQGAAFIFFWLRDRTSPWLLWWGLPLAFGGAAILLYARPDWQSDFFTIVVGNDLRMFALGSLWEGVRTFYGKRPMIWPLLIACLGWFGLCLIPEILDDITARVIIVSLVNLLFTAATAWELYDGRGENLPSRLPLQIVFLSFTALMALRIGVASIAPFPLGGERADPLYLGLFVLVVFIHSAFAAFLFFALTRERREAEQRTFALSDPLTGLLNRRAFSDFAERLNRRRVGQRSALALLVLDLDHFKLVNDRFGHEVGDRLLKAFADVAESSVRPNDQLFRMGGEEFCFALPETLAEDAIAVAERIRRAAEAMTIESPRGAAGATVSIGIAATQQPVTVDVLLAAADAAVYEAKSRGRNRIVVAEPASLLRAARNSGPAAERLRA